MTIRTDDGLAVFLNVRPRLFSIACRMLNNMAEAEDLVQDVWVRWQTADRSVVRDPSAFLATTTTRLAINVIQSARSRREMAMRDDLADPPDTSAEPGEGPERNEAVERAVLTLLEKLSSAERCAYVLREAFDVPYRRIAAILGLAEANTRQVVTRARQHLAAPRRAPVTVGAHGNLLDAFLTAARRGDPEAFAHCFRACGEAGLEAGLSRT